MAAAPATKMELPKELAAPVNWAGLDGLTTDLETRKVSDDVRSH